MIGEPTIFLPIAVQTVAYTGTAGTSTALGSETTSVRLICSSDAFVNMTQAGTAATTANGVFLSAGKQEYFRCPTNTKVSVIQSSAGGNCYITEMDR